MIPGKVYKIEDYVEVGWRHRWLLVLPFVVATVAAFAGSQFLPDRYRSEALILIVPQRVPENIVRPTVTSGLGERLNAITSQILSRTRLERVIDEFDLYTGERETELMEDVITQMREDIGISLPRVNRSTVSESFTVSFETYDRELSMRVAQRIASLFIQENIEERELQADATARFLESQLEETRRQLVEHENRLEQYRSQYAGQLPSQLEANLQVMQNTQLQLRTLADSFTRDRDRQLTLERVVADTEGQLAAQASRPSELSELPPDAPAALQLEVARISLRNLQLRLRPEHPDVIRAQQVIGELEVKAEAEALAQPLVEGPAGEDPLSVGGDPRRQRLSDYQLELETIQRRLVSQVEHQTNLQETLTAYQARIESTPARESDLMELMRDYDIIQGNCSALLQKSQQARIALNLERRQIGEQFRMIDAPRLPERPVSPDRLRLTLMASMAGLGFGLGIVGLLEYRNTSLRTHEDVVTALSLPVLAAVPLMTTRRERRHQRIVWWVGFATAAVALVGVAAAAWRLGLIQGLVP